MNSIAVMIIVAAILIMMQLVLTARGSRETCRIHAALMADAKKRARRTFGVIIPLARRAETVFPLLDHLYAQHYDKLQIIVVVKQTAGRNAEKDLQAYRKANKVKGLKVVRYRAGQDMATLTASQYVLEMQPTDRLTARFFEVASLILTTHRPNALAIRTIVLPERTFASAYQACGIVLRSVLSAVAPRALPSSRMAARRVTLGEDVAPVRLASYQFGIYQQEAVLPSLKQLLATILAGVVTYGALVTVFIFTDPLFTPVIVAFIAGSHALLMAIIFTAIRGYRFIDYLNMLLFVPLAPLYALGAIVTLRRK